MKLHTLILPLPPSAVHAAGVVSLDFTGTRRTRIMRAFQLEDGLGVVITEPDVPPLSTSTDGPELCRLWVLSDGEAPPADHVYLWHLVYPWNRRNSVRVFHVMAPSWLIPCR